MRIIRRRGPDGVLKMGEVHLGVVLPMAYLCLVAHSVGLPESVGLRLYCRRVHNKNASYVSPGDDSVLEHWSFPFIKKVHTTCICNALVLTIAFTASPSWMD